MFHKTVLSELLTPASWKASFALNPLKIFCIRQYFQLMLIFFRFLKTGQMLCTKKFYIISGVYAFVGLYLFVGLPICVPDP